MQSPSSRRFRSIPLDLLRRSLDPRLSYPDRAALLAILAHIGACGLGPVSADAAVMPHDEFADALRSLASAGIVRVAGRWVEVPSITERVPRGGLSEQLRQRREAMERELADAGAPTQTPSWPRWVERLHQLLTAVLSHNAAPTREEILGLAAPLVAELGEAHVIARCVEDARAFAGRLAPNARRVWRLSVALQPSDAAPRVPSRRLANEVVADDSPVDTEWTTRVWDDDETAEEDPAVAVALGGLLAEEVA